MTRADEKCRHGLNPRRAALASSAPKGGAA